MKKSLTSLARLTPLALTALFVVLILPMAGTHQASGVQTVSVTAATALATQAPIIGWIGSSVLPTAASARKSCDDATCNQSCIDQGGAFGLCRGNLCVCGI